MKYLLAVSGGLDSMVMLDLFHRNGYPVEIAHCNFQLRGEESDADEAFVKKKARELDIPFHSIKFQTSNYTGERNLSTQMAARELRYEWFEKLKGENHLDYICTAHHLNDTVETTFFNLIKGSGYRGLSGIAVVRGSFFRPLINFSKGELLEYAEENTLQWCSDSSNEENVYRRNYLRNKVFPLLKEINPGFPVNSGPSIMRLRGAQELLDRYLNEVIEYLVVRKGDIQSVSISKLKEYNPDERGVILDHWLGGFGFNHSNILEILDSLEAQPGKVFRTETCELVIDRNTLILSEIMSDHYEECSIEDEEGSFQWKSNRYKYYIIEVEQWQLDNSGALLQVDANLLDFPLKIRSWKEGERFRPLGMKGKKKISDFMIDHKIPVNFKAQYPVLESGGTIVGIPGMQIDDGFKVGPRTDLVFVMKNVDA